MIAERIELAREKKSMTKAELARQVEVSRASVSMWEDGKNISVANIHKIAQALEVTPEWLQYGVKEPMIKADELAECLMVTRQIVERFEWDLSDSQHAKLAVHLYQERAKGSPDAEEIIVNMMQGNTTTAPAEVEARMRAV